MLINKKFNFIKKKIIGGNPVNCKNNNLKLHEYGRYNVIVCHNSVVLSCKKFFGKLNIVKKKKIKNKVK